MTPAPDGPVSLETLHAAVRQLTRAVEALDITLKRDYPTRDEVRKRRWQIALAMVGAIIASYFITVGSISYCFLDGIPGDDEKNICQVFPGWEDSFDNNRDAQEMFRKLIETTEANKRRLDILEDK